MSRGYATLADLTENGIRRRTLERLLSTGEIIRARQNCYITSELPPALALAARCNASVTSVTLFQLLGSWHPAQNAGTHLAFARNRTFPQVQGVVWHRNDRGTSQHSNLMVSLDDAIAHLMSKRTELQLGDKLAVLDSLPRKGIATQFQVRNALERVTTPAARRLLNLLNFDADSGIESIFREYLASRRIKFREQVDIGPYCVDFVLSESIIVELVGAEHHAERQRFEYDTEREAWLFEQGYTVLRFSGTQILYRTENVARTIDSVVHSRRHRHKPRVRN